MESVRWAFNLNAWKPLREDWLFAGRCIQCEERKRIGRFVYTKDGKSAMVGRLLLRKVIYEKLRIPYESICLARNEKGKPYLLNSLPGDAQGNVNFNVSHHGSYSVLAAEPSQVGIDVMKTEYPGGKGVAEFFHLMRRQFTSNEWSNIRAPTTEREQLNQFYRHWCLKESYVKALGDGIGFELKRLNFCTDDPVLKHNKITRNTKLYVDGKDVSDKWLFEETLLDEDHCVAVAIEKTDVSPENDLYEEKTFRFLDFQELMATAVSWEEVDEDFWIDFSKKEESPSKTIQSIY